MEIFVQVVQASSLSGAASQLNLANASVTTSIRSLEQHLGVTLLQRSTRYVSPTNEGSVFYEHCRHILNQVAEAEAVVSAAGPHLRGTLRVELPIALGHLILGPALLDFAKQNPDLRVMVALTNEPSNLARRGVDVAIRMDEVDDADLIARWLYEARHVVCAAPAFLEVNRVPTHPTELDLERCLGLIPPLLNSVRSWHFKRADEAYEFAPASNLVFNSSDALLRTAMRSGGFIYVLDVLAHDFIASGALKTVLGDWQTARKTFYVVYPQSRHVAPKVRIFVEFLNSLFSAQPRADSALIPKILHR